MTSTMPDHVAAVARLTEQRHTEYHWRGGEEWEALTPPEPCESCGRTVVVICWRGRRGWYEADAPDRRPRETDKGYALALPEHTRQRCAEARAAR
jgi:hypothetical protein